MSQIKKLTTDQIARFPEFVKRWTDIGLCGDPADRPRAEAAIRESYRRAGLTPPQTIVWCGSPLSQGITRALILDKKLIKNIGDSVRDSVRDSVWASVGDSVWASVGDSVWDSVWASVRDSVGDSVRDSVRASVWASVRASVVASVRDSVGDSIYGQHDASLLAFYEYFGQVCGLSVQTERLTGLWELARSAGWAVPHKNICWVSERHNILLRDDRGRLHNLTGPACAYPDGWAIYSVHGVHVPSDVVEIPVEKFTRERILGEQNAEIRRVLIERLGNERFLRLTAAKPIHQDRFGRLYRIELADDEPIVLVEVANSTPEPDGTIKHYFLRVPGEIVRARDAVAWTFDIKPEKYCPQVET